jgi:NAD(P)-dependent dehydrogenase (short-subunit alcohol dehydrogenase family)
VREAHKRAALEHNALWHLHRCGRTMSEFNGRVVVITGAFGALGSAVAKAFAAQGARLGLIDHAKPAAREFLRQLQPAETEVVDVDLTDARAGAASFDAIARRFGRLDVLINVAGGFAWEKLEEGSVEVWDRMFAINLRTAVIAAKAALPHLIASAPGSTIVNIAAAAAARPAVAGMGAYTASKAGVQKLTESLADELKDRGITVNAILPGTIDTPQNREEMPDADTTRWVAPEAIADVILFLASPRAAAITGASIPVLGRG